jgi:hypothetical protein
MDHPLFYQLSHTRVACASNTNTCIFRQMPNLFFIGPLTNHAYGEKDNLDLETNQFMQ